LFPRSDHIEREREDGGAEPAVSSDEEMLRRKTDRLEFNAPLIPGFLFMRRKRHHQQAGFDRSERTSLFACKPLVGIQLNRESGSSAICVERHSLVPSFPFILSCWLMRAAAVVASPGRRVDS